MQAGHWVRHDDVQPRSGWLKTTQNMFEQQTQDFEIALKDNANSPASGTPNTIVAFVKLSAGSPQATVNRNAVAGKLRMSMLKQLPLKHRRKSLILASFSPTSRGTRFPTSLVALPPSSEVSSDVCPLLLLVLL